MPYIRTLRDAMTQETFFLENRTGRQFSRIVAALAWPHGIAQGCVIVLGEIRGRPAVLNVHNHVHVLNEYRSGDVADLVDMAVRLYEDWSASCVITPGDDRRVVFLDAVNDDLRRERRRRIRIMSWTAAPAGEVMTAMRSGCSGRGFFRSRSKRPSAWRRAFSCSKATARSPAPSGIISSA